MSITITDTSGFRALADDSRKRNRGPSVELLASLEPDGVHVAGLLMIHNGHEMRVRWLVKVTGQEQPASVWMDNGFDSFERYAKRIDKNAFERICFECDHRWVGDIACPVDGCDGLGELPP